MEDGPATFDAERIQLQTVVDNSPIVLVAFDSAGTITLAEGWDLPTFPRTGTKWLGLNLSDVAAGSPIGAAAIAQALAGEPRDVTVILRGRHFEFRCRPQWNVDGTISGVLTVGTDGYPQDQAAARSGTRNPLSGCFAVH